MKRYLVLFFSYCSMQSMDTFITLQRADMEEANVQLIILEEAKKEIDKYIGQRDSVEMHEGTYESKQRLLKDFQESLRELSPKLHSIYNPAYNKLLAIFGRPTIPAGREVIVDRAWLKSKKIQVGAALASSGVKFMVSPDCSDIRIKE